MIAADPLFSRLCSEALARAGSAPSVAAAVRCPARGVDWQGGAVRGAPIGPGFADRPFRIASITKPFVAAAIHRLAETGRLAIADPVAGFLLPRTNAMLRDGGHDPAALRIAHLLTHTGGLPDHTATASYRAAVAATPDRRWERQEQVALAITEARPVGAPGEVYSYSDTGYVLLGEIVEQVSGQPLAGAVRQLLDYARLGLASTWWEGAEPPPHGALPPARLAVGAAEGMDYDPSFDLFGGGGLIATLADCNRFLAALLGGEVLAMPHLVGALATPAARRPADAPTWRTHNHLLASMAVGRHWALGHTGFWGSAAVRIPALGADIAVSLNCGDPEAFAAARALLGGLADALDTIAESSQ
ncbi:serine hydrolase domain-containing protein [Erythrobacter sp. NE805]|uniref:serine hydrolase domain-containing protein n=1 Tax=Erythrobacter sp. NE805 TaxID=3389875 RepID=UPI00396B02DF